MPSLTKELLEQFKKKDVDATAHSKHLLATHFTHATSHFCIEHRQFLEQNPDAISDCLLVISHHDFVSTPSWVSEMDLKIPITTLT